LKVDDNSEFFPGISASDILKKKKAQDTVAACFKNLEKFNVWIEASVSISQNGDIMITDETTLKDYRN